MRLGKKLEWKGPKHDNNGTIKLSYRQAARCVGIEVNAANTGFHELQAKGFIVVTKLGALGVEGESRGPSYELTELPLTNAVPKALFIKWKPGSDFEILHQKANNPIGKQPNPVDLFAAILSPNSIRYSNSCIVIGYMPF